MPTLAALVPIVSWALLNTVACILTTIPIQRRIFALPALMIPATISFKTLQNLEFLPGLAELWGSITLIGFIHFSSLLYIKKWSFRPFQQARKAQKITETWLRRSWWIRLYKVTSSPRFLRVPYKDVLLPEQSNGSQVKSTSIHKQFSPTKVLWLLVKVIILSLLNALIAFPPLSHIAINDFGPNRAILIRRLLRSSTDYTTDPVSTRDIMLRIWLTVSSVWSPIIVLDCIHTGLAIIGIYILRVDIAIDWPDLFGSPLEAYTLGRFWSIFWHRLHVSGYSDFTHLLLPRFLLRDPVLGQVVRTFSLFLISGVIHQLASRQLHPACIDFADLKFFGTNAAVVCAETALLRLTSLRRASGDSRQGREAGRNRPLRGLCAAMGRSVGYIWVVSFFVWGFPKFYYQRVHCIIYQSL